MTTAAPANQQLPDERALLQTVAAHYEITTPLTIFPIAAGSNNQIIGVRSGTNAYALKTIVAPHSLALLQQEQTLLQWLANQPLPFAVPAPLPTKQGELLLRVENGYLLLMPLLPGTPPDWRQPHQITHVGAALSTLHQALARCPLPGSPHAIRYGDLNRIHPQLPNPAHLTLTQFERPTTAADETLLHWWRDEIAALQAFVDGPYRALPLQWTHGDFAHGNTLYQSDTATSNEALPNPPQGRISAVLDFEFAGQDVRAVDLAAGLFFSMRPWENPDPVVNAAAFCRGYAQVQPLTPAEVAALPWLMRLRNAVSTIWWLGRQLTTGETVRLTERLGDAHNFTTWLAGATGSEFQATLQLLTE